MIGDRSAMSDRRRENAGHVHNVVCYMPTLTPSLIYKRSLGSVADETPQMSLPSVRIGSCIKSGFGQPRSTLSFQTRPPRTSAHHPAPSHLAFSTSHISTMAPKITLYTNHRCPFAHRAHIVVKELGLEYEEVIIDLEKPREPWYLEVNPVKSP